MPAEHLSTLHIKNLSIPHASVGVHPHEKNQPQPLFIHIQADVHTSRCAHTDLIEDAVDYTHMAQTVVNITKAQHYHLLETLCERIASVLLQQYPLVRVSVEIHKPHALTYGDVSVSVERKA
jgi:dihydroneopterin aldolase